MDDYYKGRCARCKYAYDVHNNTEFFRWAYCRRYPPVKGKFPKIDPYYTSCGEFEEKVVEG